jgi:hypothetical protein
VNGHKRRLSAVLVAFVLAVSVLVVAAGPAVGAHTLAVSQARIDGFAQDGRFIAWTAGAQHGFPCGIGVSIRNLETGRGRTFTPRFNPCFFGLALGGRHALVETPPTTCGNCYGATVWTASLGGRLAELETFAEDPGDFAGHRLTGMAGDRRVLALSWVNYLIADENCNPTCIWNSTAGRVNRVIDGKEVRVPGTPPPARLAVGAGRIATAPAPASWQDQNIIRPVEDGPVNVVDADTGTPVVAVSPTGTVQALALSSDSLAVLVERADGTHAIERYAVPTGTMLASTNVSGEARDLDVDGKWIVYRVWRRIKLIDEGGDRHLLLVAPHRPLDVSIEGNRVAWAENGGGRHRLRAATVPD